MSKDVNKKSIMGAIVLIMLFLLLGQKKKKRRCIMDFSKINCNVNYRQVASSRPTRKYYLNLHKDERFLKVREGDSLSGIVDKFYIRTSQLTELKKGSSLLLTLSGVLLVSARLSFG